MDFSFGQHQMSVLIGCQRDEARLTKTHAELKLKMDPVTCLRN